jgi:LCP family protein required for cell wall assembly
VAVAIAGLVTAGALTAYAAFREVFHQIGQVPVTGLGERPPTYDNSLNILMIGSDSTEGQDAEFRARITGQRPDTILVLHLAPGLGRAILLSIPGDSVVPVLSCPRAPGAPGQTARPGRIEQIDAPIAFGGPGCLWKTVEHATHIRLDHFIELNFTGFERVVNDLGGIDICLPHPVNDARSRLYLSSGLHHVSGATALGLERIQGDQFLVASVVQEVKRSDLYGDPIKVYKVATDIASSLTTDSGLTQSALTSLTNALQTMNLAAVQFVQVPVVVYPPKPNWVEWGPAAGSLFSSIAHDRKLSGEYRAVTPKANVCQHAGAFTGLMDGH